VEENGAERLLDPQHRSLSIGIFVLTGAVAFESMAVTTIAPVVTHDFGGTDSFGWIFSSFLLAQVIGSVVAGRLAHRGSLGRVFGVSLGLFLAGLVLAAVAPAPIVLIAGRTLQGLGGGGLVNCIYIGISLGYSDALRPRALAALAGAYVLPATVGPFAAAVVAEQLSWRGVFWGMVPLVIPAAGLCLYRFRSLRPAQEEIGAVVSLSAAPAISGGLAAFLIGVRSLPDTRGFLLVLAGIALAGWGFATLLPPRLVRAHPVFAASLAARGLLTAVYVGEETFIVLCLASVQDLSATVGGFVVALGAFSWAAAAWLQARWDSHDAGAGRPGRMLLGAATMTVAVAAATTIPWLDRTAAVGLAVLAHVVCGFGMGMAEPTSGAVIFARAPVDSEGLASSNLQLVDLVAPAVSVGLGSQLIILLTHGSAAGATGLTAALSLHVALAAVGTAVCLLLTRHRPAAPVKNVAHSLQPKGTS
jgi:MFS family permease